MSKKQTFQIKDCRLKSVPILHQWNRPMKQTNEFIFTIYKIASNVDTIQTWTLNKTWIKGPSNRISNTWKLGNNSRQVFFRGNRWFSTSGFAINLVPIDENRNKTNNMVSEFVAKVAAYNVMFALGFCFDIST